MPSWLRVLDHFDDRCPAWHAVAVKPALIESLSFLEGHDGKVLGRKIE
jgi:hypothetical protein